MSDRYDYEISTEKIEPLGSFEYAAKIARLVRNPGPNFEVVGWSEHQIGEYWGVTEDEAYKKVKQVVEAWIAAQG